MHKENSIFRENVITINNEINYYLEEDRIGDSRLAEAMRYSVQNGGKRIRGFLVLEFCRMFQGDTRKALPYAVAIELGHAASLVHDDMPCMDNDDLRRGVDSCHVKYGEYTALLVGDALLSYAFEVLATNSLVDLTTNCKAVEIFSRNVGVKGMCLGQQKDLDDSCGSFEELLKMYDLKTGLPIKVAIILGCFAAGIDIDESFMKRIDDYASNLGRAYQILDDLNDIETSENKMKEKITALSFISHEEALAIAKEYVHNSTSIFEGLPDSSRICTLPEYLYSIASN